MSIQILTMRMRYLCLSTAPMYPSIPEGTNIQEYHQSSYCLYCLDMVMVIILMLGEQGSAGKPEVEPSKQ